MLISFDKPTKIRSTEEHNSYFSSDTGIAGTYVPNMSDADMKKWKGKHINKGKSNARIEIRKTIYNQILIVVTLGGHELSYKNEKYDIRISMNGPILLTFEQMEELNSVILEAKALLSGSS